MHILVRLCPVASPADIGIMIGRPILAMFARPGFCPIAGTADQHELRGIRFLALVITRHLIGNTMVDLQIAWFIITGADCTARTIEKNQVFLELLRERPSPSMTSVSYAGWIGKSIGSNPPSRCACNPECFERNALVAHVLTCSGWMAITILELQIFSCNVTVLDYVVNDSPRPFTLDCLQFLQKGLWKFLGHSDPIRRRVLIERSNSHSRVGYAEGPGKRREIQKSRSLDRAAWPAWNAPP